jgi:hypothetical protein
MSELDNRIRDSGDLTVNVFDVLEDFSEDDLCEIFKWIDKREESWSFTERMASYFFTEMLKFLGEDDDYKDEAELVAGLKQIAKENE